MIIYMNIVLTLDSRMFWVSQIQGMKMKEKLTKAYYTTNILLESVFLLLHFSLATKLSYATIYSVMK